MTAQDTRKSLHRFGLARDRLTAAVGQATGLTSTELEALEQLEQAGSLTQRQLADRLFLTSGGTTLLVDRLEQRGFVSRRPHPSDRRAVLLELNPAAGAQTAPSLERYHAAVIAAAGKLSAVERNAVAGFLDAVSAAAVETANALHTGDKRRRHERRGRAHAGAPGRR
jgi:DNA-binding MarR family transcriptional regulator